jgi:hypothetical protein
LAVIALLVLAPALPAQKVTTTAGGFVGDRGAAVKASFETPSFVVQDKSGNLYISDLPDTLAYVGVLTLSPPSADHRQSQGFVLQQVVDFPFPVLGRFGSA